ncbi:MAG: hypothetical protein WDN26_06025 [Chitinophagaceae bacterium]
MKLLSYYLKIIIPVIFIIWSFISIGAPVSFGLLFAYLLIYKPFIDGYRLIGLELIDRRELKKMFNPFLNLQGQYFMELYFENNK